MTPIPTTEPQRLLRTGRRTAVLRFALAVVLVATLLAAFLVARREGVERAPLIPTGKTGILVLDLSASTSEEAFAQTIQKLAASDEHVGLIVFSDAAYELLPVGTPGRELLPLLRYFSTAGGNQPPAQNPWVGFRQGTRISEGMRAAHETLRREGVENGSLILVSDFEILPDEIQRVAEQVAEVRGDGIDVRLVPLDPTPERRARVNAILGGAAVLREEKGDAPVRAPDARSISSAVPWSFVGIAAVLVLLLAVNERLLPRLEVRR